ncbi:hypothetical protein KQX54_013337 [Cotesia glomerata]|uniref:Uncharacterized protein n=1 Tax=Cotesia glomerata TaxID=32391 RepID=A0AAV7IYZ1_COTGL|nr:hypothetical protein KQX54_013337 [Cotesia glomerata]
MEKFLMLQSSWPQYRDDAGKLLRLPNFHCYHLESTEVADCKAEEVVCAPPAEAELTAMACCIAWVNISIGMIPKLKLSVDAEDEELEGDGAD